MQRKTPILAGAFILIILAALAVYLSMRPAHVTAPTGSDMSSSSAMATGNATVGASGQSQVISYTDNGFSPATIIIAEGTTVTWINKSSRQMWIGSGTHPDHIGYNTTPTSEHCVAGAATAPTVFDECTAVPAGGSYSFTLTKVGTWSYHNHEYESDTGTIVVTAGENISTAGPINTHATPN